ncbi:MAG: hypothetical protein IKQ69_02565 [Oscillospiraceae bacterium]|nr:hypothetical protein [Oscillospiraceae bacterium]MBR6207859.1 hypothetical protein [Oscillospiraceae bacterium]
MPAGVVWFLILLVVSIAIGAAFKKNIGIFAVLSAFLIAGFIEPSIGVSAVFSAWPSKLFVTLLFVMFWFGFAVTNGTLSKMADNVVWAFRGAPWAIPFVLFLLILLLSAGGMATYACFAFMGPIVVEIAKKLKMHRIMVACIVIGGSVIGGMTPISQLGLTHLNTITNVGYTAEEARHILWVMFANNFIGEFLMFLICYFVFKTYKVKLDPTFEKPSPLDETQRKTLWVFGSGIGIIVLFSLLYTFFPKVALIKTLYKGFDITLVALVGIILCNFLKIGEHKKALSIVPLDSLILVCGISVLVSIGTKAGAVDALSAWAGSSINGTVAPYFMVVISAIYSLFAAAVGVVVPTMATLIPGLVAANAAFTPAYLFSLSNTPAILTGYSPFSSGGSITMSGVFDQKERDELFKWLLVFPAMSTVVSLILTALGLVIK